MKAEDDALDDKPPKAVSQTFAAIRHVEETVTRVDGIEGIVLRYGGFYGPGTSIAVDPDGEQVKMIRKGRLPIVGDGAGVWSFVHIEDAASATAAAVERGDPGAYNVVDDDPVPVSEFLPELARVIGAKPSRRVPRWLGRLLGGQATVVMMTVFRRLADIPQPRATRQDRRSVPVHTPRLLPRQRRAAHAPPQGFAERCCGGVHPRPGARVTSRATEVASKTVAWYSITPKAIETLAVAMQAGQGLAFCDRRRVDRAALCAQTEPGAVPISVHGRSPNQGCCGDLSGRLAAVVRKRLPRGRSSADHGEVRRASASARRAS